MKVFGSGSKVFGAGFNPRVRLDDDDDDDDGKKKRAVVRK